ncbi:MAG: alpha/beta hydrolase fold domain-containing protein [Dermatophilaceae bacterium]
MLSTVSLPLSCAAAAVPARPPRRGEVDQHVWENLCYAMRDGYRPLYLDLHVPRTHDGSSAPVVVWVHGGGWMHGTRRRLPPNLDRSWLVERTLLSGLAVALVDYRLAAEAAFPAAVDDLSAAVAWVHAESGSLGVDPSRMALWGESAGAHLALLTAARLHRGPHAVAGVVDWYGPTDPTWFGMATPTEPEGGEPGVDEEMLQALHRGGWLQPGASPVTLVRTHEDLPPVLIAHGRDDRQVPLAHSQAMQSACARAGVPVELVEVDGGHVFEGSSAMREVIDRSIDFLCRHLGCERGPFPDRDHAAALATLADEGLQDPFATDDAVEARRRTEAMLTINRRARYPVDTVTDHTAPGPNHAVPLRVQRPVEQPQAVVLFLHGGGWVVGSLDSHQNQATRIAASAPATVVQVDYRLAPEHPFPAGYEDCITALQWVRGRLPELGSDRLVLAGDSAGGNLALALALHCRDAGIPTHAVFLNYPAVDWTSGTISGLPETYLGADEGLRTDPRVSPAMADLRGLPPVVMGVGALDAFADDVLAFAYRLREAQVPTTLRVFPALDHAYFSQAALSRVADRATEQMCRLLSGLLWSTA